jgi:hypothetical protein
MISNDDSGAFDQSTKTKEQGRPKDWWDRTFDDGPTAKKGCFGFLGLAALLIIAGPVFCSSKSTEQEQAVEPQEAKGANEADTGAMCDLAVKSALVSEDSFDPEWGGSFHAVGDIGVMTRKFDSTNGFGAKITSRYTCKWNSKTDTIVSLEITDPFGETRKLK